MDKDKNSINYKLKNHRKKPFFIQHFNDWGLKEKLIVGF